GRGQVDVVQQPTARNGYTAIVRVRDPQGGAGNYRINAFWQPVSAGEVAPPFGRDRGYDRNDRNDRGYDRNDRGDDRDRDMRDRDTGTTRSIWFGGKRSRQVE